LREEERLKKLREKRCHNLPGQMRIRELDKRKGTPDILVISPIGGGRKRDSHQNRAKKSSRSATIGPMRENQTEEGKLSDEGKRQRLGRKALSPWTLPYMSRVL